MDSVACLIRLTHSFDDRLWIATMIADGSVCGKYATYEKAMIDIGDQFGRYEIKGTVRVVPKKYVSQNKDDIKQKSKRFKKSEKSLEEINAERIESRERALKRIAERDAHRSKSEKERLRKNADLHKKQNARFLDTHRKLDKIAINKATIERKHSQTERV